MKALIFMLAITFSTVVPSVAQTQKKVETVTIRTSAQCDVCKSTIEKALFKLNGVVTANLDLTTKAVTVSYRTAKLTVDDLRKAISSIGYDADDVAADPKAYENLNGCCKKGGH